jgi:hypothetical protein
MPHAALAMLQKALFSGEPALCAPPSPVSAQGPELLFVDIYERAAARLTNLGFVADVRTFRMGFGDDRRTLAVYVNRHDARLEWTGRDADAVPAVFEYRLRDRRGHDVTLFSGSGVESLRHFLGCLTRSRQLASPPLAGPRRPEWDPHRLEGQQYVDFVDTLGEFERITGSVEQQMLSAQLSCASLMHKKVAANHHFIDEAVSSAPPQC